MTISDASLPFVEVRSSLESASSSAGSVIDEFTYPSEVRMKLSNLAAAEEIRLERYSIASRIDAIRADGLAVTFNGRSQGAEIVETARSAITDLLNSKISVLDEQLRRLGVDLDA